MDFSEYRGHFFLSRLRPVATPANSRSRQYSLYNDLHMMFKDYLSSLNLLDDEGSQVEFKEAQGGLPSSIWKSMSAFANRHGGRIFLGVDPAGGVLGLANPDEAQRNIASRVWEELEPALTPHIDVKEFEGKRVVEVHMLPADPHMRPVYLKKEGLPKGAYKRVGSANIRFTDEDFARIYAERSNITPDAHVVDNLDINSLNPALINAYRNRLRAYQPESPLLAFDDQEFLQSLNVVTLSEGKLRPKRAGVLLFGKEGVIREAFPAFFVQLLELEEIEWNLTPEHRGRKIDFSVQGLVELASKITDVLGSTIPEEVCINPGQLHRQSDPIRTALREAVVNALVHQDFLKFRPTQIRRYSNRLEIDNPGMSKKPIASLNKPGSIPRNPILASAFNRVGLAEQAGSGIISMINGLKQAGLATPDFRNDEAMDQFTVTFYWHNFVSREDLAWLGQFENVSEDEKRALLQAKKIGRIDNSSFRAFTGEGTLEASRPLSKLTRKGYLARHGKGANTHYTIPEELLGSVPERAPASPPATNARQDGKTLSGTEQGNLFEPVGEPRELEPRKSRPRELEPRKSRPRELEPRKSRPRELELTKSKPSEVASELSALDIRILGFCIEARRLSEIASEVERNREHVRSRYIKSLMEQGLLEFVGPSNSPSVRYQTTETGKRVLSEH